MTKYAIRNDRFIKHLNYWPLNNYPTFRYAPTNSKEQLQLATAWIFITTLHDDEGNISVDSESTSEIFIDKQDAIEMLRKQNQVMIEDDWTQINNSSNDCATVFYKDGYTCNNMVVPISIVNE